MSIAAAFAADKEQPPFRPAPATSFSRRQTNDRVTVGTEAYTSPENVRTAFGKLDPNDYGVLPVLVVIQNDGGTSIHLDRLQAVYVGPNRQRVEATPAKDVRFLRGANRPNVIAGPGGTAKVLKPKKNPLAAWEIEGRAFAAKMLPPGQSASGFFYFQASLETGATIYLSGMTEAGTEKDLFYFEIPLR